MDFTNYAYADDAQLYLSFEPDNVVSQAAALDAMERCIRDKRSWMIMEKLQINDDKTEFMIVGFRQQLEKDDRPIYTRKNKTAYIRCEQEVILKSI